MNNIFVKKMMKRYDSSKELVGRILENRNMYETGDPNLYHNEQMLLKILDAQVEHTADPEVYSALWATALWYCWKYVSSNSHDMAQLRIVETGKNDKSYVVHYDYLIDYLQRRFMSINVNKVIFVYSKGRYYENRGRIQQEMRRILSAYGITNDKKVMNIIDETMRQLCETIDIEYNFEEFNSFKNIVPCRNTCICREPYIHTIVKSPAWGFTYELDTDYVDDVDTTEVHNFINDLISVREKDEETKMMKITINKDEYNMLMQVPAQVLLHGINYQQSTMLCGAGANGKSTYLKLVIAMTGRTNISSLSLSEITGDKFKQAELIGKLVNVCSELPNTSIKSTEKFKALTGGDYITCERKFEHPLQFINKAVLIFSANELPEINDASYGFWRRWNIIEFHNKFPVNPKFEEKLITEKNKSALLKMCLTYMNMIDLSGLKSTTTVDKVAKMWSRKGKSTASFWLDCISVSSASTIESNVLYDVYYKYCVALDKKLESREAMGIMLHKNNVIRDTETSGKVRKSIYCGIKLNEAGAGIQDGDKEIIKALQLNNIDEVLKKRHNPSSK